MIAEVTTNHQRVRRINKLTAGLKTAFFEIAVEMRAIKDSPEFNSKSNKVYLEFIETMTGYRQAAVYNFLRAHEAMGNIEDFTPGCKKLPDNEKVIRPLATKKLNADPERQAAIWEQVVEQAGDKEITAKMVKDAISPPNEKTPPPPVEPVMPDLTPKEAEVGLEFIKVAYRELSKRMHPDVGGTHEDMEALNSIKEMFKNFIDTNTPIEGEE